MELQTQQQKQVAPLEVMRGLHGAEISSGPKLLHNEIYTSTKTDRRTERRTVRTRQGPVCPCMCVTTCDNEITPLISDVLVIRAWSNGRCSGAFLFSTAA